MAEAHEEPLSSLGILREALVLPKYNKKVILQVFLLSLFTTYVLSISFSDGSFLMVSTPFATTTESDASKMLVYLIVVFPISAAVKTLVISSAAVTYTKRMLAIKDSPWTLVEGKVKRPLFLTHLLVVVWSAGCFAWPMSVVLLLLGEPTALNMLPTAYISSSALTGNPSSVLLYVLETISLLFLTTFWSFGLIVSVLERGRLGLGAVRRAIDLAKRKRWKGLAVVLAAFVLHGAASEASKLCYAQTARSSWRLQKAVVIVSMVVREALGVYISGAYAVYYYECRRH